MINVIGSVLTGLFLGKKIINDTSQKAMLPSFKGVIEVKHMIEGRVRFYIPKLIGNEAEKEMLVSQMLRISSISKIEINTITGSLLVCYDVTKIEPMLVFSVIIKLMGLEEKLEQNEKPKITNKIQEFGNTLNKSFYENTQGILDLKTLLPVVLIVWGVKKIAIDKNTITPGPYNLFWWGYSLLRKG